MAFRVGDIVTVRSVDRIKGLVNALSRRDGCLFMPQMFRYCGRNFRIVKVVKNVFDEGTLKMNTLKSPMYLLEGVICEGEYDGFRNRCDRTCHMFWHEDWLDPA